ncbi:MAG TPA: carboxypeptidase regulatory-like domain-containing protein [Chitinophagaceae bacterium]|nr:carboxypeptidase regulatory-like domain-containing protein [Chitinophagaceae bacterium]HCY90438.1 carboxypeptidase regulatory-like domain-containing protein [Chitinophagaceae bacterium]
MRILGLLILMGLSSCSKDSDPIVATRANISGSVNLYDEGTTPSDKSGMTVSVVGLTPAVSSVTDSDGKFLLADVPFGTYTLSYAKAGYGTYQKPSVVHSNTGTSTVITSTPSLGKVSTTQVTLAEVRTSGSDIILSATTNPAGSSGNRRYIRFFLSNSASVSKDNYSYVSPAFVAQINPFETTLTAANLSSWGFASGQTVYIKVYGDSFWSNEYEDAGLGRKVFPNLNATASNTVSFLVP